MGAGPSRDEAPVALVPEVIKEEIKTKKTASVSEVSRNGRPSSPASTPSDVSKTKEAPNKGSSTLKPVEEIPKMKDELVVKPSELSRDRDREKNRYLPHAYEAIVKMADVTAANGDLLNQVRSSGIFLNNKKQKYWVDEKTGHNCFMAYARDLLITWSENQSYWQWVCPKEQSGMDIEMASLLNVCWLEIHGRFETSYLTPKVTYEVVFVVLMELGYGWATPVNLRLKLPNGEVQEHKECLLDVPRGRWIELKAGEFVADGNLSGPMEFTLYEYEGGQWKRGLIVKGAIIRPKK